MSFDIFVQSWSALARVVIVGALAYIALVALLRMLGDRTLAKMNAYDWVVTFALGRIPGFGRCRTRAPRLPGTVPARPGAPGG